MATFKAKDFYRRVDKKLLIEYFDKELIPFEGIELTSTTEEHFQAFINSLPDDKASKVISDFFDVDLLSSDYGIDALLNASSKLKQQNIASEIGSIEGEYNKALFTLINYEDVFKFASQKIFVSNIKINAEVDGLNKIDIDNPDVYVEDLKNAVSEYLMEIDGRGIRCKVDHYIEDDSVCFMLYPEDYAKVDLHYKDTNLEKFSYKPAMRIVYIYHYKEGRLQINSPFQGKKQGQLLNIFNLAVLKNDTDISEASYVYEMKRVLKDDFRVIFDPKDMVNSVFLKEIKLKLDSGETITLNLDFKRIIEPNGIKDILNLMDKLGIDKSKIELLSIAFRFDFSVTRGSGLINAKITTNGCNLGDSYNEKVVRKYLTEWGIRRKTFEDEETDQKP